MPIDPTTSSGMLEALHGIAADAARLRTVVASLAPTEQWMVEQLITHLDWTLTDLADRPGILSGEMPWWQQLRKTGT